MPRPSVKRPKLVLGGVQSGELWRGKIPSGSVYVEGKHGHGRSEWIRSAPNAALGRALKRFGDLPRVIEREHAGFEIQRVTGFGYSLRPSFTPCWCQKNPLGESSEC